MPDNVIIGVNILETLTTGMYRDAKVIYREYIQNACDQVDEAVCSGLLAQGEERIEIWIDNDCVSIEDNATGIPADIFKETLYNIGESPKDARISRGFRGIGHWCGFAHCNTLVFTAKAVGEQIESIMTCDALKQRSMMREHRKKIATYSIDDVLSSTTVFTTRKVNDSNAHYFKVELIGITDAAEELCNLQIIKEYLSFIIPVDYATEFRFRKQIHQHAIDLGQPISEYTVTINGEDVRKQYKPTFSTHGKGNDVITDVKFKDFFDDDGNLVAWLWFGVSSFKAQMVPANKMRGIRLRSQNIQIGDESTLQKLFNESNGRGLFYYIGEVFADSEGLLPDSQRDYFELGDARTQFEQLLFAFFNDELKSIYYAGSKVNSAFGKIDRAEQIETEVLEAVASGKTVSEEQRASLERARREAESATSELAKIRKKTAEQLQNDEGNTVEEVVSKIIKANDERRAKRLYPSAEPVKQARQLSNKDKNPKMTSIVAPNPPVKSVGVLVSLEKIYDIIRRLTDPSTANAIIAKIEEELV